MKNRMNKKPTNNVKIRYLILIVLSFFTITNIFGCVSKIPGELIKPYYKSAIKEKKVLNNNNILTTLSIKDIEFEKPDEINSIPVLITKLFPVISLLPLIETQFINARCNEKNCFTLITRKPGEIETLLVTEIEKSGLFNKVSFKSHNYDYELKGKVNFAIKKNTHTSGLGIILWSSGLVISAIIPPGTDYFSCTAHFDLYSKKHDKILFSKDYSYEESRLLGFLFAGHVRNLVPILGQKIFPNIVDKLVSDIKINLDN